MSSAALLELIELRLERVVGDLLVTRGLAGGEIFRFQEILRELVKALSPVSEDDEFEPIVAGGSASLVTGFSFVTPVWLGQSDVSQRLGVASFELGQQADRVLTGTLAGCVEEIGHPGEEIDSVVGASQ